MTIKTVLTALPLIFAGWIGTMAAIMVVSDAAPAAVVFLPSQNLLADLPEGTSIISVNSVSVTLKNEMPGFGAALYKAGAYLVLPAGLTGCLPLPGKSQG